jgi:hypothetical protein
VSAETLTGWAMAARRLGTFLILQRSAIVGRQLYHPLIPTTTRSTAIKDCDPWRRREEERDRKSIHESAAAIARPQRRQPVAS